MKTGIKRLALTEKQQRDIPMGYIKIKGKPGKV